MRIVVVGPLPPPIHGASVVTRAVAAFLVKRGNEVRTLSSSPLTGRSKAVWHVSRIWACLVNAAGVLQEPQGTTVYFVPSGGLGLVYDVVVVAACRLKSHCMLFHHHSFAYIDRPNPLMRFVVRLGGAGQRHILLSDGMAAKFRRVYGEGLSASAITNLAHFGELGEFAADKERRPYTIGYLSNITLEKGIDKFLDVVEALRSRGSSARGLIAGPFSSSDVEAYVRTRLARIGGIEYLGPLYGDSKAAFYRSLDLFLFPSRYVNEAQPVVIYEAKAEGVRVAATNRGCLAEMLEGDDIVLDSRAADIEPVVNAVLACEQAGCDPDDRVSAVARRRSRFRDLARAEAAKLSRFFDSVCGGRAIVGE